MKILLAIIFAATAAFGNAMFALGQKNSAGVKNGFSFLAMSATVAVFLIYISAPIMGAFDFENIVRTNWRSILLSGVGLFLTYLGFNLLYSRYGVSYYILYAVLSIISTTIMIGIFWLKEPVNLYQTVAIVLAIVAVILFSIGQSKL